MDALEVIRRNARNGSEANKGVFLELGMTTQKGTEQNVMEECPSAREGYRSVTRRIIICAGCLFDVDNEESPSFAYRIICQAAAALLKRSSGDFVGRM